MPLFGPPNIEKLEARHDINGLIKALRYQKERSIRERAAEALGRLGDPRAVEPLCAALQDTRLVAMKAAEALGKIGDWRAVEPLSAAIKHVGKYAAEALDKLGWQPGPDENGAWYWATRHAWDKCLEIGKLAVEPLNQILEENDMEACLHAAEVLGQIGDERAVTPLFVVLDNRYGPKRTERVRQAAAEALGKIGHWRAVEPLLQALREPDRGTRQAAARALVAMYHGAPIAQDVKQQILAVRSKIMQLDAAGHHDIRPSCGGHEDSHTDRTSIGVDFPL